MCWKPQNSLASMEAESKRWYQYDQQRQPAKSSSLCWVYWKHKHNIQCNNFQHIIYIKKFVHNIFSFQIKINQSIIKLSWRHYHNTHCEAITIVRLNLIAFLTQYQLKFNSLAFIDIDLNRISFLKTSSLLRFFGIERSECESKWSNKQSLIGSRFLPISL